MRLIVVLAILPILMGAILLNGKRVDTLKLEAADGNVIVTTTSGAEPPAGCTNHPDARIISPINWGSPGPQVRLEMPTDRAIISSKFTATGNPGYSGQANFTSTTGNASVGRRVWISKCAGRKPLPTSAAINRCDARGSSSTVVRWAQNAAPNYCQLLPNASYYLNVRNLDCDKQSCDVYRNLYNNGNP